VPEKRVGIGDAAAPARPRLVVGISGSSAPQYGIHLLRALHELDTVETHLILSEQAGENIKLEAGIDPHSVAAMASVVHDPRDYAAAISSGSFVTSGMVVVPCSMSTLASIASGITKNLLVRAADVTLKERRRLVLVPRETPLNLIHLSNMVKVTEAGATVLPPMPAFYHRPRSIEDLIAQTTGKILDQFGIEHDLYRRWSGTGGGG
jgi:polyprenyl P-hydroxybenzoate/phenylacrylic acid decarboxylase-like protein